MLHWSEISEKNIYYLQARCSSPYCHFLDFFALHTCPFFTPVSKTVHITFISNGRLSLCMTCFSRPSTRLTSLQMLYFIWLLLGLPAWAALQSVLLSVYWQLMSNGRIPKWPSAVLLLLKKTWITMSSIIDRRRQVDRRTSERRVSPWIAPWSESDTPRPDTSPIDELI